MDASRSQHANPGDPAYFAEKYAGRITEAERKLERKLFGDERGRSGYLTTAQAARVGELLNIGAEARILELGAGRGWLGIHLVASSEARVVLSDVPFDALRSASGYARDAGVASRVSGVCVDGAMLPFGRRSFDAVVHSDVFC